jgi:hypothetical protein
MKVPQQKEIWRKKQKESPDGTPATLERIIKRIIEEERKNEEEKRKRVRYSTD